MTSVSLKYSHYRYDTLPDYFVRERKNMKIREINKGLLVNNKLRKDSAILWFGRTKSRKDINLISTYAKRAEKQIKKRWIQKSDYCRSLPIDRSHVTIILKTTLNVKLRFKYNIIIIIFFNARVFKCTRF